jgi:transcriptional regulator with XRE-family HTH domain
MTRGTNKIEVVIRQIVASNIRMAREHAEMSQRDLCDIANIGQAYLSQCESGKWNVGIDNIAKIARATGFLPHQLLNPDFDPVSFSQMRPRGSPSLEDD